MRACDVYTHAQNLRHTITQNYVASRHELDENFRITIPRNMRQSCTVAWNGPLRAFFIQHAPETSMRYRVRDGHLENECTYTDCFLQRVGGDC